MESKAVKFSTLPEVLKFRAESSGETPAFIFRGKHDGRRVLSWQQIYHLGSRWSEVLRSGSLGQGDLVVNTLPNSPERVITEVGVLLSGAASVNGQCQLADGSDLLHVLRKSRAHAIVLDPDLDDSPWNVLTKLVELDESGAVTSAEDLPDLKRVYFVRRNTLEADTDFLGNLEQLTTSFHADIKPDDVLTVFTTSGTTGFSKLVVYTHKTLVAGIPVPKLNGPLDINFNLAPLGWPNGHIVTGALRGSTRVLCDVRGGGLPRDLADFAWRSIVEEKCTSSLLLPAIAVQLARRMPQKDGAESADKPLDDSWKLDRVVLGGVPITRAIAQAAKSLAKSVSVIYGATDFGFVSAFHNVDPDTFVDYDSGTPMPGVLVKIVDDDNGTTTQTTALHQDVAHVKSKPAGNMGNILVKSPRMMKEYLNDHEATAAALTPDGYFRTGDIGCLDERSHLIVQGRGSDAIMRGPYIFYPGWLEARIRACPGVSDVAVVGVPDPMVNEELCACLVMTSDDVTVEQVRQFVEKDILASEDDPLSPRPRHYLRFQSFPVTDTNKTVRKLIKEQAFFMVSSR